MIKFNIHRNLIDDLRAPVMLAAWPGMGSVGLGAVSYFRRHQKAVLIAEVDIRDYFSPDSVVVDQGIAKFPAAPSSKFYYLPDSSAIVLESEAQIGGEAGTLLMKKILDLVQNLGVQTIFTGAAFAMPVRQKERVKVFGVANDPKLRSSFRGYGVEIMKEGRISGMNGLLLGFAGMRDLEAGCLLATTPQYAPHIPNPKASHAIIHVFERILDTQVDSKEIEASIKEMDRTMTDIESKIRSAFANRDTSEDDESFLAIEEEKAPQYAMERIEKLFREVKASPTREMATKLKVELDKWKLFTLYEDRFLGLFRRKDDAGT